MANPVTKREAEYQYYTRKCAANSITIAQNAPLVDFKKAYWSKITGNTNNQATASDLEWNWLGTLSGVTGKTLQDRWIQAAVSVGAKVAGSLEETITNFYIKAP